MPRDSRGLGKVLYGALFLVVLPSLLALWARATTPRVALPVFVSPAIGVSIVALGLALIGIGMLGLWVHGEGLPMNAFPPPKYASRGIYAVLRHPIYVGFSLACVGASIACGSQGGFWLVTPTAIFGCAALVFGYERHDLVARFGANLPVPWLRIPSAKDGRPTIEDRVSVLVLVLVPWAILYELVVLAGPPAFAVALLLPFEPTLPVLEWSELVYASTYLVVLAAPILARKRSDLRAFAIRGLLAIALVFPIYFAVPVLAPPRPFVPHGALGMMLAWERALDTPCGAFPSFHVIWALLAAEVHAASSKARASRMLWRAWAWLVAASCITTGMHSIADVVAGFLTAALVMRAGAVWDGLRRMAERIANSWREWRIGSVRVINHGAYAGAGTFVALAIVGMLAGSGSSWAILVMAAMGLVGAALWAQYVEGSPQLLRPYGFYGGVLGTASGAVFAPLLGSSPWLLLAAYCVAGPWVQSAGRLRCLVQGCCHGRPAPASVGIQYSHPRSRVLRVPELANVPLHPTPLYSILWNVLAGVVLARLWSLHAALPLVAGVYLMLNGLGRFVEESYRGEPQTPMVWGLRLYQWTALASVLIGAIVTAIGPDTPAPASVFSLGPIGPAAVFGAITAVALGVDFPESRRRFSRLG